MFLFLVPLLAGFFFNSASTFTSFYARHLGELAGRRLTIVLRDVLGIPVWVVGYALAARAAASNLFAPTYISSALAWLVMLSGAAIIVIGLISLRLRAAAPSIKDTLVIHGIYAHIRHPLYSGMVLELVGLLIWIPTYIMLIACSMGVIWAVLQSKLEEIDLLERLPGYDLYRQRVQPFIPRLRLR